MMAPSLAVLYDFPDDRNNAVQPMMVPFFAVDVVKDAALITKAGMRTTAK